MRSFYALLAALMLLSWAPAVSAHHGWSHYVEKAQQLTGTIQTASLGNPHATLDLKVGEKLWHVVLSPPSRMETRGLPGNKLVVGETVTVEGYVHKTNPDELRAEWIEVGGVRTQLR